MNYQELPFGPTNGELAFDDFSEKEVNGAHCSGQVCQQVCKDLEAQYGANKKFLTICIPCFNEELQELIKTIDSVMKNVEFMQRKARFYQDSVGRGLQQEFLNTVPIIVPIFDGIAGMSPSVKEWLNENFPGSLDCFKDEDEELGVQKVEVRAACRKWWYFCHDTLPSPATNQTTGEEHMMIHFHMTAIVKRNNHRKHNSHQWFFDGICQGLGSRNTFAFLTDCGTTYDTACLARLFYELRLRKDLIGVTARQRVELPGAFFHPCQSCSIPWMRGDHPGTPSKPCLKCYLAFFTSPAPLQGFEFEATLIMNCAMFNMVEALPVMPGPCQLLNWQKMKEFHVVEEYFNLLFNGESENIVPPLHESYQRMSAAGVEDALVDAPNHKTLATITFTEFLRVTMRLAEDRVLSFVCVFTTGYGTKWIPGATFYYQPEVTWQMLLKQRRRWLNGTFASFILFFRSARAVERVKGGLFDSHKVGKNIRLINGLWFLQLVQLLLVLFAPAVFGSASYIGLLEMADNLQCRFDWVDRILGPLWLFLYLVGYVLWTFRSFSAPKGLMPEALSWFVAIAGFFVILPVYLSIWWSVVTDGLDVISVMVIGSLALPVLIATAQSVQSAMLYFFYLPWFMIYIVFFLVFIPSYSFARLWDTTWGNRATAKDTAITDDVEGLLKRRNYLLICCITFVNVAATWVFIQVFKIGYEAVMAFMIFVFSPMIIQLVFSFLFLFLVVPARYLSGRSADDVHALAYEPFDVEIAPVSNNTVRSKRADKKRIGASSAVLNPLVTRDE